MQAHGVKRAKSEIMHRQHLIHLKARKPLHVADSHEKPRLRRETSQLYMFKRLLASQHSNVVSRRNTVNASEVINPKDGQQNLLAHQVDKPGIKRLASFEVENSSGGNEPEDSQSTWKSAPASCDDDRITIKVKEPQ